MIRDTVSLPGREGHVNTYIHETGDNRERITMERAGNRTPCKCAREGGIAERGQVKGRPVHV